MDREFYTVRKEDIGRHTIFAFRRPWLVVYHFGKLQSQDIGKRICETSPDVLQMENDEQFKERCTAAKQEA